MEQVVKFAQGAGGDQRRTENEGGTSSTQHPGGQRAGSAAFQPDENDFAAGRFLAPMDWQALAVEGVPAIVDRYDFGLRKMMGIM